MVYEFTGNNSDTYIYGHRLLYSNSETYVLNAHGDVVATFWENAEHCAYWADEDGNLQEFLCYVDVINETYDYDAFGIELDPSKYNTNPFRHCDEYFDVESGQIYLRNRYYQPVIGRFTQIDPIRDGLNWYAYCGNNPVVFIDKTGFSQYYEVVYTLNKEQFRDVNGALSERVFAPGPGSNMVLWVLDGLSFAASFTERIPAVPALAFSGILFVANSVVEITDEHERKWQNSYKEMAQKFNEAYNLSDGYTYSVSFLVNWEHGFQLKIVVYNKDGNEIEEFTGIFEYDDI